MSKVKQMATRNITITYPDQHQQDIITALKWHFGPKEDGTELTTQEALAFLDNGIRSSLKDIFTRYKRERARALADASVPDLEVS